VAEMRSYQPGFYEKSAAVRDAASRARRAAKIAGILQRHARRPVEDAVCLDIGCSSGLITTRLAPLFRSIIGIEYDELALGAVPAQDRSQVGFVHGDAMRLPLADGSVQVILCAQVYEHVPSDARLAEEIYRVLAPGGLVFFSGPNWLFPVELHYNLPFVHWLPERTADAYLRLFHKADAYYERSRSMWGLRRLWRRFEIEDVTLEVLETQLAAKRGLAGRASRLVPRSLWRLLLPLFPNFNWLLWKPENRA
jgi:SAM-dependent methyltransferase